MMQKSETIYSSDPRWPRAEVEEEALLSNIFKYHKTISKRYFKIWVSSSLFWKILDLWKTNALGP